MKVLKLSDLYKAIDIYMKEYGDKYIVSTGNCEDYFLMDVCNYKEDNIASNIDDDTIRVYKKRIW